VSNNNYFRYKRKCNVDFATSRASLLTIILRLARQDFQPVAGLKEKVLWTPFSGYFCPAAG